MKFEIENFKQWDDGKVKASFSLKTEGGMVYDMKLIEYGGGHFVATNQQRSYDSNGETKYDKAFQALKGTPAADFFDAVAKEAAGRLRSQSGNDVTQNGNRQKHQPDAPDYPDDTIPF